MPTYSYACTECGHRFDAQQAFTDDTLTTCPECGGRLRKMFGNVGVVFKGSGFYRTDARAEGKRSASRGSSGSSTTSSESSSESSNAPATTSGDSSSAGSTTSTSAAAASSGTTTTGSSTSGSKPTSGSTSTS